MRPTIRTMSTQPAGHWLLAEGVLAAHLAVIAFNLLGLILIPVGAWRGWRFVHRAAWRLLHAASWAVVALQALLGRACLLTDWEDALSGEGARQPLVMRVVNGLIFWPMPLWAFTLAYVAVFAYVLWLLVLVPIAWPPAHRGKRRKVTE